MEPIDTHKLIIDADTINNEGITLGEFLYALIFLLGFNVDDCAESLIKKGLARYDMNQVVPSIHCSQIIRKCLNGEKSTKLSKEEIEDLAIKLKAIYPKGYQSLGIPWTEGPKLIAKRLENFFLKYGDYPAESVIAATTKYVEAKQNTPYMKTLKNFIYKETTMSDGLEESSSDLYTWLENPSEDISGNMDDWTAELREEFYGTERRE